MDIHYIIARVSGKVPTIGFYVPGKEFIYDWGLSVKSI